MHQNQWLAVIEELGGNQEVFPVPNSFPQDEEAREFSYSYMGFQADGSQPASGRWSEGTSIDGNDTFTSQPMQPMGEEPNLGRAREKSGAQAEQM